MPLSDWRCFSEKHRAAIPPYRRQPERNEQPADRNQSQASSSNSTQTGATAMQPDYKVIHSLKQAAAAKFFGCTVNLIPYPQCPNRIEIRVTPVELAEDSINLFESGELLPARPLLDCHADLYRQVASHHAALKKRRHSTLTKEQQEKSDDAPRS